MLKGHLPSIIYDWEHSNIRRFKDLRDAVVDAEGQEMLQEQQPHGALDTFHRKSTCPYAINFQASCGTNLVTLLPPHDHLRDAVADADGPQREPRVDVAI